METDVPVTTRCQGELAYTLTSLWPNLQLLGTPSGYSPVQQHRAARTQPVCSLPSYSSREQLMQPAKYYSNTATTGSPDSLGMARYDKGSVEELASFANKATDLFDLSAPFF